MRGLPMWFHGVFLVFALALSTFYGLKAFEVFGVRKRPKNKPWMWHQRWFNFVGSLVGWAALWFLVQKVVAVSPSSYIRYISVWDAAIFVIAFIGVTGHLPYTIMGLIESIRGLALLLIKSFKDLVSRLMP